MPVQGLHLITPSAAVATGTGSSATINANGSVTFSAVTALELRGVFSVDYDNYQIVCRMTQSTSDGNVTLQMVSGSSVDSTSNYVAQTVTAQSTIITGARSAAGSSALITSSQTAGQGVNGTVLFIYGPYLAQPTVGRGISESSVASASIYDSAWSHNVSSAFDGIKFTISAGTTTGLIAVYGMRK